MRDVQKYKKSNETKLVIEGKYIDPSTFQALIEDLLSKGIKHAIISAPAGAGKTTVSINTLADKARLGGVIGLFICKMADPVKQVKEDLQKEGNAIHESRDIVTAVTSPKEFPDYKTKKRVFVMTADTFQGCKGKIAKLGRDISTDTFPKLLTMSDEAHQDCIDSYRKPFALLQNDAKEMSDLFIEVSATNYIFDKSIPQFTFEYPPNSPLNPRNRISFEACLVEPKDYDTASLGLGACLKAYEEGNQFVHIRMQSIVKLRAIERAVRKALPHLGDEHFSQAFSDIDRRKDRGKYNLINNPHAFKLPIFIFSTSVLDAAVSLRFELEGLRGKCIAPASHMSSGDAYKDVLPHLPYQISLRPRNASKISALLIAPAPAMNGTGEDLPKLYKQHSQFAKIELEARRRSIKEHSSVDTLITKAQGRTIKVKGGTFSGGGNYKYTVERNGKLEISEAKIKQRALRDFGESMNIECYRREVSRMASGSHISIVKKDSAIKRVSIDTKEIDAEDAKLFIEACEAGRLEERAGEAYYYTKDHVLRAGLYKAFGEGVKGWKPKEETEEFETRPYAVARAEHKLMLCISHLARTELPPSVYAPALKQLIQQCETVSKTEKTAKKISNALAVSFQLSLYRNAQELYDNSIRELRVAPQYQDSALESDVTMICGGYLESKMQSEVKDLLNQLEAKKSELEKEKEATKDRDKRKGVKRKIKTVEKKIAGVDKTKVYHRRSMLIKQFDDALALGELALPEGITLSKASAKMIFILDFLMNINAKEKRETGTRHRQKLYHTQAKSYAELLFEHFDIEEAEALEYEAKAIDEGVESLKQSFADMEKEETERVYIGKPENKTAKPKYGITDDVIEIPVNHENVWEEGQVIEEVKSSFELPF